MQNPYMHHSMIQDPLAFFGRRKELNRLYALLAGMQSVSVVGERRIGKSSLLYCSRLPQIQSRTEGYDLAKHAFAYVDLAKSPDPTPNAFLRRLIEALRHADSRLNDLAIPEDIGADKFEVLINAANERGLKPVFLLDEFDTVAQADQLDLAFFNFLRSLANSNDLAFVTASTQRLTQLCKTSVLSSPFFNIFGVISLGVLEEDEALDLIRIPSSRAGCSLGDDADFLLQLSGRHPFLLQIACFFMFEQRSKQEPIDHGVVCQQFSQEASDHFTYWKKHPPEAAGLPSSAPTEKTSTPVGVEVVLSSSVQIVAQKESQVAKRPRKWYRVGLALVAIVGVVALIAWAIVLDPTQAIIGLIFLLISIIAGWIVDRVRRQTQV